MNPALYINCRDIIEAIQGAARMPVIKTTATDSTQENM